MIEPSHSARSFTLSPSFLQTQTPSFSRFKSPFSFQFFLIVSRSFAPLGSRLSINSPSKKHQGISKHNWQRQREQVVYSFQTTTKKPNGPVELNGWLLGFAFAFREMGEEHIVEEQEYIRPLFVACSLLCFTAFCFLNRVIDQKYTTFRKCTHKQSGLFVVLFTLRRFFIQLGAHHAFCMPKGKYKPRVAVLSTTSELSLFLYPWS